MPMLDAWYGDVRVSSLLVNAKLRKRLGVSTSETCGLAVESGSAKGVVDRSFHTWGIAGFGCRRFTSVLDEFDFE